MCENTVSAQALRRGAVELEDAPQLVAREPARFHVDDDREGINELLLLVVLCRLRSAMTTTNVKATRLRPFAIEIAQTKNERDCFDEQAIAIIKEGGTCMFNGPSINLSATTDSRTPSSSCSCR